jgi:amino acid adenylation domain-containing protein
VTEPHPDPKRELLARLLQERSAKQRANTIQPGKGSSAQLAAGGEPPLRQISRDSDLPLSFGQERIWFLEELQPESLFYNILSRISLKGELNVEALRQSIEAVVARHEVLRASFTTVNNVPVQRIAQPTPWSMPIVDLRRLAGGARDKEERRLTVAAVKTRFDLANGPLLKTLLLRLTDDQYVLVLTIHHIITDGWSMDVFLQEMAAFYRGFIAGTPPSLPDLVVQYPDFADWQRRWLSGRVLEKYRTYWADKLRGPLPFLEVSTAKPGVRTFEGHTLSGTIDSVVLAGLRELSRKEGVTLYITLLAALKTLLLRYTNQDDVIVGTLVAGRTRPEVERMMGFFVNTLALRTDLSGDPTFRDALARTRDVVIEAQTYADFPFEKLVAELNPERSLGRNPFFQVVFNMLSFHHGADTVLPGVELTPLNPVDFHAVTEGLLFYVFDRREKLEYTIVYSPDLFDAEVISGLEKHYQTLLAGIIANPARRLSELPLLTSTERQDILNASRGSVEDFPLDRCFSEHFEAQVKRSPNAVAVVDASGSMTYAEINSNANRIARTLVAAGVEPGQPVALFAERSRSLLIWILATFKAGGAYLPLDPNNPSGRHAEILRQSAAKIIFVADELVGQLEHALGEIPTTSQPVVFRAQDLENFQNDAQDPPPRARPDDLAYIIFTSGSTGSPKGAMVSHRAMLNHFWSKIRAFTITSRDIVVQTAPQGFDISVWQFLAVLLAGGQVRIAPDAVAHDPARLFALVQAEEVTILELVPSFIRAYLDGHGAEYKKPVGSLRWLLTGGETVTPELCRRWLSLWPRTPIAHGYGPSECADDATREIVAAGPGEDEQIVPIGRPIDNVQIYILDRNLDPVPRGVAGELFIAGVSVGLGYLNDSERTAAAFLSDPFSCVPGARIYRTGDRARMRIDGRFEFLGRLDHQVKIRGHRIELGEIETALARHPMVAEAIVNVQHSSVGDRLIAYVVAIDQHALPTSQDLSDELRKLLPGYMVPDAFVNLSALPLTAHGKINRNALPAPELMPTVAFVAARTPNEEIVSRIWSEVLRIERVGVHDNFFELGGHSLLATQLASRLRAEFALDIPLRLMFEKQTVAELAGYVDEMRSIAAGSTNVSRQIKEPVLARVSRERFRREVSYDARTNGDN